MKRRLWGEVGCGPRGRCQLMRSDPFSSSGFVLWRSWQLPVVSCQGLGEGGNGFVLIYQVHEETRRVAGGEVGEGEVGRGGMHKNYCG